MTYEESLCMLSKDKWHALSDEQKVEVFQTIENKVSVENGRLSCPVEGKFLYTGEDGIVLGSYNPNEEKIYINNSQFDELSMYGQTPDRLVKTLLHEGRHALQDQAVKGLTTYPNKEEIEVWRENLSGDNYISYKDNPRAYYNQPVEVDARKFADERYKLLEEEQMRCMNSERAVNSEGQSARDVFEKQMESDYGIAADYEVKHSISIDQGENTGVKM